MLCHAKYQLNEDGHSTIDESTIFLEPVFLQCSDGTTRKVFCYLRHLGTDVYLALVCRPLKIHQQRITKSISKTLATQLELIRIRCHKTANFVSKQISSYISFLQAKGLHQKMHLAQYFIQQNRVPGLLHFIFVDRTNHQVIQSEILSVSSTTPSDPLSLSKSQVLKQVQSLLSYSHQALNNGMTQCIIRKSRFLYSYRLWAECSARGFQNPPDSDTRAAASSLSESLSRSFANILYPSVDSTPVSGTHLISKRCPIIEPPKISGLANPDVADSKYPSPPFLDTSRQRHATRFGDIDLENNFQFPPTLCRFNYKRLSKSWFPKAREGEIRIFELYSLYLAPPSMGGRSETNPTRPTLPLHGVVYRDQLLLDTLRGPLTT